MAVHVQAGPTSRPRDSSGRLIRRLLAHLFLATGAFFMILPFLWMLSTSLKPLAETFAYPPKWIPYPPLWHNYVETVNVLPFGRLYLNSLIQSVGVTLLQLLTSSLAAFAFARLQFPGRDWLFLGYLATLMIPFYVTLIPNFILIRMLHWIDTYFALIIPPAFSAFSTFLLRQYFMSIPFDLDDAARIDGASSLGIWWHVILPLSGPALASLTIFTFLGQWNNFLWPLVVTNSDSMRTLPVGLASFQGQHVTQWNLMMAGSMISLVPILVVYIVAQKHFIQGLALTGMGGR